MPSASDEPSDFSVVLGGPLYQLYRRTRMATPHLELLARRVVIIALLAWLPLLLLTMAEGTAVGGDLRVPFAKDVAVHVRFLVALPLLIVAELIVHRRMRLVTEQFLGRGLIPESSRSGFEDAITRSIRLRNSLPVEVGLLAFVLVAGHSIWASASSLGTGTWFAREAGSSTLTAAGTWYSWISTPIFQFILLRWYFRLLVWVVFLWKVARLRLHLIPTHPDGAAGLGFLGEVTHGFAPLLMAQGALLSGVIANRIFYDGAELSSFRYEALGLLLLSLVIILGPLLVFGPALARARRNGLAEYGGLASRYVQDFQDKWIRAERQPDEPLVGSADIQSLADLEGSFEIIRRMRVVPFERNTVLLLAGATALPWLPLILTVLGLNDLLGRLSNILL